MLGQIRRLGHYQPKWIPNFYFGYAYARQFYRHAINALGDTVNFFSKDLPKQEIGSLFFRFSLPDDFAEFYGEMVNVTMADSQNIYGQHILCMSLLLTMIESIAQKLLITKPYIYQTTIT